MKRASTCGMAVHTIEISYSAIGKIVVFFDASPMGLSTAPVAHQEDKILGYRSKRKGGKNEGPVDGPRCAPCGDLGGEYGYCTILGFQVDWEMDHRHNETLAKIVGLAGVDVRMIMLKGYGLRVELVRYYTS